MGLGLAARSVARAGLVAPRRLATATMKSDKHAASALCSRMRTFNSPFLSTKPSLVYLVSSLCDDSQLASCSGTFGIWVVYVASLPLDEQFQSLSCENTTSQCPQYASPSLSTWIHVLSDCPSLEIVTRVIDSHFFGIEVSSLADPPFYVYFFLASIPIPVSQN